MATLFWSLKIWTEQMWPGHSISFLGQRTAPGPAWLRLEPQRASSFHPPLLQTIWSTPHGPPSILSQSRKAFPKAKKIFVHKLCWALAPTQTKGRSRTDMLPARLSAKEQRLVHPSPSATRIAGLGKRTGKMRYDTTKFHEQNTDPVKISSEYFQMGQEFPLTCI